MKHFEITLFVCHSNFVFKCSTIHGAYEAIKDIKDYNYVDHINLDGYMHILCDMEEGKLIQHNNHIMRIEIKEGEV